jgi:predicted ATP-dependent endonuclease of OLD family
MRLTKLRVKGFRSIKNDETLNADQKVTILIGANDHGKSNLLAAIQCLNDDQKIKPDDRNWDLGPTEPVEIEWHFALDKDTIQKLDELVPKPPEPAVTDNPDEAAVALLEPVNPTEPTFPINDRKEIVFGRDLARNQVSVLSLPVPVPISEAAKVLALRPRVELFESPEGNVVDTVTRAQLDTPSFEFMQGIFRLAGLWDVRDAIFAQNDTTSKQLKEASARLTQILNDKWNQGKDLQWIFEHTGNNGDTIVIQIEDPAIKGRYTRPSLRSSGFRTYFLLSMIVYARSQNTPSNSHIYLFDEPGTYLHPSAQLDLQRSFEAIADQAQLVYTTHALFLISKNYPERNRVISKTTKGTKIDQKPFSKNWKSIRQSLGILLSNNFLIAEKTLLVEGPSDTIYLLEALKTLKSAGKIDVDLNDLSIVDAGDSQNFVALAKIMLSEGRSIVALMDGDASGKRIKAQLEQSCQAEVGTKKLHFYVLPENKSSEDVFAELAALKRAISKAFQRLVDDKTRTPKDNNFDVKVAIEDIKLTDGTSLGRTIEETTKLWFVPKDKISKLLIAVLYEDEIESAAKPEPPAIALEHLQRIKELLGLRGEKSAETGVFEEVE